NAAPERVVPDPGGEPDGRAQPGQSDGHVRRAASDEGFEERLGAVRLHEVDERLADDGDDTGVVRRRTGRAHAARSPDLAPVMIATASGMLIAFVSTSAARRPRR